MTIDAAARPPDPASLEEPSRLAPLDGLRAVAILAVMAFHYSIRWTPPRADANLYPYGGFFTRWPLLDYGWAGVELFFVISGFVIGMTLERSRGAWDFARRRIARLWPAMLACAAITMLVAQFGPAQWKVGPLSFLSSILFIEPNLLGSWLHHTGLPWVDGVYWTLWVEVRFYIMAAVLFFAFRRRFLTALTAVTVVSFVAGLRDVQYPHRGLAWLLLLPTFLPYFTFGAALRRWRQTGRIGRESGAALSLSVVLIFAGGWLSFEYPAGGPIGFAIVNAAILALFALFATGSRLLRPFAWRPLARLGEASYSLYLVHSVVGIVLIRQFSKVMPWPVALTAVTVLMIALAFALFRWVEAPGKRLILAVTARPLPLPRLRFSPAAAPAESIPSTIANG